MLAKIELTSYLKFSKTQPKAYVKKTLFAQMIQLLPAEKFKKLANELEFNKHSKGIDSWTHLGDHFRKFSVICSNNSPLV